MTDWKLIKLNFERSMTHLGEVGIGIEKTSERVYSDALFSAWITAYARLFKKAEVQNLLAQFPTPQSPEKVAPFSLSSTFLYRTNLNGEDIYYLPRPLSFPRNYPHQNDLAFFKTYKKLRYLPLDLWQRWYQGEGFTSEDREELINKSQKKTTQGVLEAAGTFDYSKGFKMSKEPKIAVDRISRATNFYHTGLIQFQWKMQGEEVKSLSGLYFLLNLSKSDQDLENNLCAALNFLGEEGLGGERSSGAGRFTVEWLSLSETWQKIVNFPKPNYYSLISVFWRDLLPPEFVEGAFYELEERGGWIAGQQLRRKMVRMFAEGSIFRSRPVGQLADVTPSGYNLHPVYRSGISLSLPIHGA